MAAGNKPKYSIRDVPAGVWILGFVSTLWISPRMIHAQLPLPRHRARRAVHRNICWSA